MLPKCCSFQVIEAGLQLQMGAMSALSWRTLMESPAHEHHMRRGAWRLLWRCCEWQEQGMGERRPWRRWAGRRSCDFIQSRGRYAVTTGGEAYEHETSRHETRW